MANFAYMSGTGNDFLVGKYEGEVSEIQIIALVSDAEYEVDGIIFVEPLDNNSVKMHYYNNDGSIFNDISTLINIGVTVGFVCESVSGKSTLALAMMGYTKQGLYTISGQCLFKSKNLLNMTDRDLEKIRGKEIAMIPQNAGQSLTPNLKIGYQIEETLKLHSTINTKDRQLKITELLHKVRLPSPKYYGSEISS